MTSFTKSFLIIFTSMVIGSITAKSCFWDIVCIDNGSGYCCSSTWDSLVDESDRRVLEASNGTKFNTFQGIPAYLNSRRSEGTLSDTEYEVSMLLYKN